MLFQFCELTHPLLVPASVPGPTPRTPGITAHHCPVTSDPAGKPSPPCDPTLTLAACRRSPPPSGIVVWAGAVSRGAWAVVHHCRRASAAELRPPPPNGCRPQSEDVVPGDLSVGRSARSGLMSGGSVGMLIDIVIIGTDSDQCNVVGICKGCRRDSSSSSGLDWRGGRNRKDIRL